MPSWNDLIVASRRDQLQSLDNLFAVRATLVIGSSVRKRIQVKRLSDGDPPFSVRSGHDRRADPEVPAHSHDNQSLPMLRYAQVCHINYLSAKVIAKWLSIVFPGKASR